MGVRTAGPAALPVFRSRLQGLLLATLLGRLDPEWTLEELARACGEPYQTVSGEIRRLQSGGLVLTRTIGRSNWSAPTRPARTFAPLAQLALMSFGLGSRRPNQPRASRLPVARPTGGEGGRETHRVGSMDTVADGQHEDLIEHLVERSGPLKQDLVAFLGDRRLASEFNAALEQRYGGLATGDEDELALFFDTFLLQHRLRDGRTPVERFVRARGDLPRAERDMMRGWTQLVESVFEVGDFDGQAVWMTNLIDELPYRVWSNMGPVGFEKLRPGTIAATRLVPVLDQWLISGPGLVLPPDEAEPLLRLAAERAATHPEAQCRNERHRARARQMQQEGRARFIAHFGSDQVIVPGAELERRTAEFWEASGAGAAADQRLPEQLTRARTVGVVYDEVEGLGYYEDFGDVLAAFESERSSAASLRMVREYLEDEDTSPMPLLRCVRAHPERADAVFAEVLRRPGFSWARDGDTLLRRHKANYLDQPPNLGISVVSDRLILYLNGATPGAGAELTLPAAEAVVSPARRRP